ATSHCYFADTASNFCFHKRAAISCHVGTGDGCWVSPAAVVAIKKLDLPPTPVEKCPDLKTPDAA
ncbi:hypothetical protein NDU88_010113, partial [Pleurodeles waltl]